MSPNVPADVAVLWLLMAGSLVGLLIYGVNRGFEALDRWRDARHGYRR